MDESKAQLQHHSRLISKFKENGCEKVERLVELHLKYLTKSMAFDQAINEEKAKRKAAGEELGEMDEEYYLTLRLDEGHLFTLQLVDRAIAYVATTGEKEVRTRFPLPSSQSHVLSEYDRYHLTNLMSLPFLTSPSDCGSSTQNATTIWRVDGCCETGVGRYPL